ncbi:hypothetical protein [Methylobacterium sp. SI9]|uniref:hypothetical protein n=1 Tax=Methylobacterium guangdongense TaxID=3138811 RepID=UPI00313CB30D
MDKDWKEKRLDELWEAYLPGILQKEKVGEGTRIIQGIEAIFAARSDHRFAKNRGDVVAMLLTASRGRLLWQLLTVELADWMLEDGIVLSLTNRADWDHPRTPLKALLDYCAESGSPLHRDAIEPAPLLLPRWLLNELRSALDALDEGEVHDLVRPIEGGRHGDAWTWDQMRACALEHVGFLHGQGIAKQIARRRVSAQTSISEGALRDWERNEELNEGFKDALEAGRLKIIFEDNPRYAESDGNTVNGNALARLHRFKSDPSLADFGKAYRQRFGHRHNPGSTAGD